MAWTTPKTWASGYVVLAADLNTHLRDNLNVTAPAVMSAQGDIIIASGANTPIRLAKSTTSTQYLANTGTSNAPAWDEVALATGVSGVLPVANGGVGVALSAPGADRILFWDHSATAYAYLTASTNLTISGTTITADAPTEATESDMEDQGTSNANRFVSPEVAKFAPSASKSWLLVNQTGTQAIQVSYNVASIADGGAGITDITFTTAFSSVDYVSVGGSADLVTRTRVGSDNAGTERVISYDGTSQADGTEISVAMFGTQ